MTAGLAKKAIRLFFDLHKESKEPLTIKFFGGEPLLEFALLKELIGYVEKKYPYHKVQFHISTNGILLRERNIFGYLRSKKNIRLFLSIDGQKTAMLLNRKPMTGKIFEDILGLKDICKMSNVTVNMVIAPNQARVFYANFLYLSGVGFKYFNFLPAYFTAWSDPEAELLSKNFKKIASYYRKNLWDGRKTRNSEVLSRIPFFNEGMVVDCDGRMYFTNMIFSHMFAALKKQLAVGNVRELSAKKVIFAANRYICLDISKLLREHTVPAIFRSTMRVDKILTEFVMSLTKVR
jgi:sulfatase maturation enzyme AslB (radical SAM superfamily)